MGRPESARFTRMRLTQATNNLTQLLDYLAKGGFAIQDELVLQGAGQKITVVREGAKHKAVRE